MGKEYIAGISTSDGWAQLAVFEMKDREPILLHVEEYARNDNDPLWFLRGVLAPSSRELKKLSRIAVALEYSSVFLHAFPMDTALTQAEQNEHVHWELSHLIAGYQAKDHICDLHVLKTHAREQVAEILVVAVRRSLVFEIQRAISQRQLEIGLVDTGYFATEHALLASYPEIKINTSALVVVGDERTDIGWNFNGRLIRYETTRDGSPGGVVRKIRSQLTELPVSEVYLSGRVLPAAYVEAIGEELGLPVTPLNPFRRLIRTSGCRALKEFRGLEYRLSACVGIALQPR